MTRRRFSLTNIRCVTVGANARRLVLFELLFDRYGLWICRFLTVLMASSTGRNRNVRRQSPQRNRTGDVDVAGGAFHDMLAFAAFVAEPR